MGQKIAKLIRKYAKRFREDPKILKRQFKALPEEGQDKLVKHMKDFLKRYPFNI